MTNAVRLLGALAGLVVSCITLAKYVDGVSLKDSVDRGLAYASWSAVAVWPVIFVAQILNANGGFKALAKPVFAVGVVVLALIGTAWGFASRAMAGDDFSASVMGFAMLAIFGGVEAFAAFKRLRPKKCLDCYESVKQAARVCKHCGYRFEPPLATDARASPTADPQVDEESASRAVALRRE
jgi:hypothetical protein